MTDFSTTNKSNGLLMNDILASLVVFLVALPLCLGIALASSAPIISGLLSGIVGGIIIGILSGSHTSVSGPAAGLTAVIASQISTFGSFEIFLCAVVIAGFVQVILGLTRMGFIAAFFPSSVIKGLLAAIGFILIFKQIPHLAGLDLDYEGNMAFKQLDNENTFSEILKIFNNFHMGAMIVGFSCLLILLFWEKIWRFKKLKFPAPLAIAIFGTLLSFLLPLIDTSFIIGPEHLVQIPLMNSYADLDVFFAWPDFSKLNNYEIYLAGITLALVASLETLLNIDAVDKIDPKQRESPPNRELIAHGIGNMLLGFIGGLPVTSVVVRSSVNINANAQSKKSTIFHGFWLLIAVVICPQLLNNIPLSCLAAILIVTGLKLAGPKIAKQMWSEGFNQFVPFLITFLAIVFSDLLIGVIIGLVSSLFFILHSNFKRPIPIIKEKHIVGEIKRIVLSEQVSFLNRASLAQAFLRIPNNSHVILDASNTIYMDADILDMINDFKNNNAPARDIILSLVGFKDSYAIENLIQYPEYATLELQKHATPKQVLELIKEGNMRVREKRRLRRDLNRQILGTSAGQFPLAVILSCIDSRVPVELIFDLGIGDVFSIRIAGNVISPKILGSLEFACAIAQAKLILVMGHTSCGAVSKAIEIHKHGDTSEAMSDCKHLHTIVGDIQKVINSTFKNNRHYNIPLEQDILEKYIIKENVLHSIENIQSQSSVIASLIAQRKIAIEGCIYDVNSGVVEFLSVNEFLVKEPIKESSPLT